MIVDRFEFVASNKNDSQATQSNSNQDNFEDEMTPVDDGDMPF